MVKATYYGYSTFSYFLLRVLIPKGRYKGQMPNMLVRIKIPAKINSTIARIPEITCVKYKTITRAAITNLMVMSIVPMFFFIRFKFLVKKINYKKTMLQVQGKKSSSLFFLF